jgi:hypothetical protein
MENAKRRARDVEKGRERERERRERGERESDTYVTCYLKVARV